MYFWLWVVVFVVWLWLVAGVFYGRRQSYFGGFVTLLSLGSVTLVAVLVVLFGAPYWVIVYRTLLQPG